MSVHPSSKKPSLQLSSKQRPSLAKLALAAVAFAASVVPSGVASAARGSVSNNSSIVQLPACASQTLRIALDSGSARGKTEAMEALRVFASYSSLAFTPVRTEDGLPAMRIAFGSQTDTASAAGSWTELQWRLKPLKTLDVTCDTSQPVTAPAAAQAEPEPEQAAPKAEPFKAREAIQAAEVSIAKIVDQDGQVISEDEVDWLNDDTLGSLLGLSRAKVWRETVADSIGGLESRLVIELKDLQDDVVGRLVKSDGSSTVSIEKLTGLESAKYTMAGDRVATISLRSESGVNIVFALSNLKDEDQEAASAAQVKNADRIRQAEDELSLFDADMESVW